MALDTSNSIRVDLQEIFNSCEQQTAYLSRVLGNNGENQKIVISADDYELIWPWANEAAVLIADSCNYITSTEQTALDAISNHQTDDNPLDEFNHVDLQQNQKQTGELLSKRAMDTLEFNIQQMDGITPLKYTVTQSQIRAAIIEYVLFKWYELNRITDSMTQKWQLFEYWKKELMTNSLNMQKSYKVSKPYRMF